MPLVTRYQSFTWHMFDAAAVQLKKYFISFFDFFSFVFAFSV